MTFLVKKNPRERLFFDANPWIGLVIFQQNIVERLIFFYEVVFQKKRIVFAINHGGFQPYNLRNHHSGFVSDLTFIKIR